MGAVVEMLGEQLATDILREATDEIVGRSNKKWAAVLVAAIAGMVIAIVVMRRRHPQVATDLAGQQQAV